MRKIILVKVVNKYTGKNYHVIENEMNDDIVNLYMVKTHGLSLEKSVGNKTFHTDYEPTEKFEMIIG